MPTCLSPCHQPSFLTPMDANTDLLTSSINSLEQLNGTLLKGRIHMHKHVLRAQNSLQLVCSTSTQGHKDMAFQEHYQPCNKVQGKLTAAGDRAKPSPKNINSIVIFLTQSALHSSKHGAFLTWEEKGKESKMQSSCFGLWAVAQYSR